jgi:Protein of unknown function (DUF_B2219)
MNPASQVSVAPTDLEKRMSSFRHHVTRRARCALRLLMGVAIFPVVGWTNCPPEASYTQRNRDANNHAVAEAKLNDPMKGDTPSTAVLQLGHDLQAKVKQVASAQQNAPTLRLTIDGVEVPPHQDLGIRVFLNKPDADRETPIKDPHYVGSFTLLNEAYKPGQPEKAFMDINPAVKTLGQSGALHVQEPLRITLVAVPLDPNAKLDKVVIPVGKVTLSAHE